MTFPLGGLIHKPQPEIHVRRPHCAAYLWVMNPHTVQTGTPALQLLITLLVVLLGFGIMLGGRSCVCWLGRGLGDLIFGLFSVVFRGLVLIILLVFVYLLVVSRCERRVEPEQAVTVCRSMLYGGTNTHDN